MNNLLLEQLGINPDYEDNKDYYEYIDFNGGAEDENPYIRIRVYKDGHEEIQGWR